MKLNTLLLVVISITFNTHLMSQDLPKHQWGNRLLLIISNGEHANYNQQIKLLEKNSKGLKERKLIIYDIHPTVYRKNINHTSWKKSEKLYQTYHNSGDFEVILIGLDGGIKYRKTSILKMEELFAIIDAMPMRRAELKRQ